MALAPVGGAVSLSVMQRTQGPPPALLAHLDLKKDVLPVGAGDSGPSPGIVPPGTQPALEGTWSARCLLPAHCAPDQCCWHF